MFRHVELLLALRKNHPALRTGKQWHIGWDDSYYAFLRELPDEKIFVVYNNAATDRALEIPVGDTPLENAVQFQAIFGNGKAEMVDGKIHTAVGAQSAVLFSVR